MLGLRNYWATCSDFFHRCPNWTDDRMSRVGCIKGDVYAVPDLVAKMQNCAMALDQPCYRPDLEALHTLESTIRYLRSQLGVLWAEEEGAVSRGGCEAN